MSNGEVIIPPTDLTTAAIQAVNLILSQFGLSPLDVILGLFAGKPKFDDTLAVIAAYNQSAYWPLHALAADMQIWVKNGAPISDSNPAVQATFGAAKQGTVESIQQFAGEQPGPNSPGYWTIFALIQKSWALSGYGEQAVLQTVRALDALTQVLAQLNLKPPTPPPPPPPPGGPPPPPPPPPIAGSLCEGTNPDTDEIIDSCVATQNSLAAILAQLQAMAGIGGGGTGGGGGGGTGIDACCTAILLKLTHVVRELTVIATALTFSGSKPLNIDFTPIVQAVGQLTAAVSASEPLTLAIADALTSGLPAIANAISTAPGTDTKPIVDAINHFAQIIDIKPPVIQALVSQGFIDPQLAQVVQSADFGDWILTALRTAGWTAVQWVWKAIANFKPNVPFAFSGLTNTIAVALSDTIGVALAAGAAPLYPEVKGIIDAVVTTLQPTGLPDIGNVKVDPDLLLSKTLAPVLIINAVTLIFDYFGWEISEQLKEYVDVAAELVGLQEIRELKVGQMMRFGPMREAELRAKGTYRQEIAGLGTMASWVSRGLYSTARYNGLAPLTGTPIEQVQPTLDAAYGGLGIRRLLPLIRTGLFTNTDLVDEMTFAGIRPASQSRMLLAAPYIATTTERNALRSTMEKVYINGLYSDPELINAVNGIEHNFNRDALILQRCQLEKLIVEVRDAEAEYTTMFIGGLITDPVYRGNLAGIGLQPDMINALALKAEARANATLQRKAIAAAAALQKATDRVTREAALKNFEAGNTPIAAYSAALLATGLTPVETVAWTDLALLKQAGNVRWIYGLQLIPAQATQLKQRVTALTDQRKRQLITQQQYVDALTQLGISATWINALDAAAEAMLTPKKSAFAVPVLT